MVRNISIGIEVGSAKTRVAVGEIQKGEKNPRIIGIGEAETRGVRHGYVVNPSLAAQSIKEAVAGAEKTSGLKIKRAALCMGGATLSSETNTGEAIISKADGEVTPLDIEKAVEESEANVNAGNKKILKIFPLSFKLDGKEILGRPEGMIGTKLEIKTLFITCSNQHFEDLVEAASIAGIDPTDVVPSPLSAANMVLSAKQKMVGAAVVDIGSETTTIGVFENEIPLSVRAFSIGSSDITNDIALGMKVSLDKAEAMKLGNQDPEYPKKKLDEIIEARLSDIFELLENHLKKIKRNGLLPAGVIFVGGGANTIGLEEFAKTALGLPSCVGETDMFSNNIKTKLRDPSWFPALGLLSYREEEYDYLGNSSLSGLWKGVKNTFRSSVRQLMP